MSDHTRTIMPVILIGHSIAANPNSICAFALGAQERYQFLRIKRLLITPEDVIHFEILGGKSDQLGNGDSLPRLWILVCIVALLHGDS